MTTPLPLDGFAPLSHWGVIRARGTDAVKFLQGQLTNDVATLDSARARLAGFCSAKGRLQASFVVWKPADDEVLLGCSASVLAPTLKRLSMFVLRSQCKLSDAGGELALTGVAGDSARALVGDMPFWATRSMPSGTLLRLPDAGGSARGVVIAAPGSDGSLAPPLPLDAWRWLEVQSGIATIEAATAEQFVPQMLNYELVGGVDFQKGCYPGQEVVARSQYRGTIKRRMHLFDCDAVMQPGQEVFHSGDASQPAGMVVNAAPRPSGSGASALVEVKLAALGEGTLHLGGADGALLKLGALPYALPPQAALV